MPVVTVATTLLPESLITNVAPARSELFLLDSLVIRIAPTSRRLVNVHVTVWSGVTVMLVTGFPLSHVALTSCQFAGTVSAALYPDPASKLVVVLDCPLVKLKDLLT